MQIQTKQEGLCATCKYIDECSLSIRKNQPVLYCEEFDPSPRIDDEVDSILYRTNGGGGGLISILQDIQATYSYLPAEILKLVARKTRHSLVDIYAVATFYKSFSLQPRGKHLMSVCLGTACHVRGAPRVVEECAKLLGIEPGQTTADGDFTLETVNCLGACALGPVIVVDGHYFSNVKPSKVKEIIETSREGLEKIKIGVDKRIFPVEVNCSRCNHTLMDYDFLIDGYPSIRITMSFGRQHGWIRLSSLYGSYSVEVEHDVPFKSIIHFFCPHCHTELSGVVSCPECGAKMVPLFIKGGGTVQICPRRGCKGHLLSVV